MKNSFNAPYAQKNISYCDKDKNINVPMSPLNSVLEAGYDAA